MVQQTSALLFTCHVLFSTLSSPSTTRSVIPALAAKYLSTEPHFLKASVPLHFLPAWVTPPVVLAFVLEKRKPLEGGEGTDAAVVLSSAMQTKGVWRFVHSSVCSDCSALEIDRRLKNSTPFVLVPAQMRCRKSELPCTEVPVAIASRHADVEKSI